MAVYKFVVDVTLQAQQFFILQSLQWILSSILTLSDSIFQFFSLRLSRLSSVFYLPLKKFAHSSLFLKTELY